MTGGETRPTVAAREVGFSFGRLDVLRGLSLTVERGSIVGLLGANGAGKTTFIRLLVGLLHAKSGSVEVLGEAPSPRVARRIGYMPQLNALYLELSAKENVEFFARMYGLSNGEQRWRATADAIGLVGLSDRADDPILRLSGGMRQRVSLACALVHKPDLLLLDEPTVGLDPELRATFWEHFRALAEGGQTILISSHTMDDAAHCDRLAFLRDGHVIADGSPEELRAGTGDANASLQDAFLFYVRQGRSTDG